MYLFIFFNGGRPTITLVVVKNELRLSDAINPIPLTNYFTFLTF